MDKSDFEPPPMMATLGWVRDLEVDAERGRVVAEFRARPDHTHSGGIVQGGFVTGWLDSCMARAAIGKTGWTQNLATLEVKISFFKPALAGMTVRVEAWVERMGKSIVFLAGRAYDEQGEVVATGSSTARLLRAFHAGSKVPGPDTPGPDTPGPDTPGPGTSEPNTPDFQTPGSDPDAKE